MLSIFQRVNPGNISIRHHWTGDRITLHSFTHKGYWFHGRNRNRRIMEQLPALVSPKDCVLDIGGHIGYTALYFSFLVGNGGHVYVFEPSPENLRYLKRNVVSCERRNITVIDKAVSDSVCRSTLYLDGVTGQTSTIIPEFKTRYGNGYHEHCLIETMPLDRFVADNSIRPQFINIDIEGAELYALRGMTATITSFKPRIIVEVNLNAAEIWQFFATADYNMYDESGARIASPGSLGAVAYMLAVHASDSVNDLKN